MSMVSKHICECKHGCDRYAAGKVCAKCHFNPDKTRHDTDTWTLEDVKKERKLNE